jgi:hypothetical protein
MTAIEIKVASVDERPVLRSYLDEYLSELRRYGDVGVGYPYSTPTGRMKAAGPIQSMRAVSLPDLHS